MKRHLLSIGVNGYRSLHALAYAHNDAKAIFDILTDKKYGDCERETSGLLLDPAKHDLEIALERFTQQAESSDQLIVYFAGHGQLSKDLGLFLCGVDTKPDLLASSGTSLDFVDSIFRWSACKHALILLDCCFGGAAFKGVRFRGFGAPTGAFEKVSGRGRVVISGSDQLQPSRELEMAEHGLFTHHLVQGIRSGAADFDSDGTISTSDIFRYTYEKVSADTDGHQRPVYSGIDIEGEFYLAHNPNRQFSKIRTAIDRREMVIIPAGSFYAGRDNESASVPAFYIDVFPVTNADYLLFIEATGHRPPRHWESGLPPAVIRNHPVVFANFNDAAHYAAWAGKRLPTELEWEKAARGEKGYTYPWGHAPTLAKCNARESEIGGTTEVNRYRSGASPYGVHDMSGNVWEWCDTETAKGRRVLRGGSFNTPFEYAAAHATNDAEMSMMDDDTGFRCAIDLDKIETLRLDA